MRYRLDFLVVTVLAGLASGCSPSISLPGRPAEDPTYAVYSVVLDSLYRDRARTAYIVADSTFTSAEDMLGGRNVTVDALVRMEAVPVDLVEDYIEENQRPVRLEQSRFRTTVPVQIVGGVELDQIREATMDVSGYPESFAATGDIGFSQIGFSRNGRLAAVHVIFRCGGRCGRGQIVLLRRERDGWAIDRTHSTWRF